MSAYSKNLVYISFGFLLYLMTSMHIRHYDISVVIIIVLTLLDILRVFSHVVLFLTYLVKQNFLTYFADGFILTTNGLSFLLFSNFGLAKLKTDKNKLLLRLYFQMALYTSISFEGNPHSKLQFND